MASRHRSIAASVKAGGRLQLHRQESQGTIK